MTTAGATLAVALWAYGTTLAPGMSWANYGEDGSELIAAALVRGVAHPPGYPTYLLLAQLLLGLPLDPARAITLISPLAATFGALLLADLIRQRAELAEPWASLAGGIAAISLLLQPLVWSQAVIAEVYTLSMAAATLLLWGALARPDRPRRHDALPGLVAGLGLGLHLLTAVYSLAWWWLRGGSARAYLGRAGWIGLGGLVLLYLPISAAADPPINWGDPQRWPAFWWLVSGQLYRGFVFSADAEQLAARLSELARQILTPAGIVTTLLAIGGLGSGKLRRPEQAATITAAAAITGFGLGYGSRDGLIYLLLAMPILLLWVGLGAAHLASRSSGRTRLLLLSATIFLLWSHVPTTIGLVNARHDTRAQDYLRAVLAQAPSDALIFSEDDRSTFPLWYGHFGLQQRSDLRIVAAPLLGFEWYRGQISRRYGFRLPADAPPSGWEAALAAQHRGPICRSSAVAPYLRCESR